MIAHLLVFLAAAVYLLVGNTLPATAGEPPVVFSPRPHDGGSPFYSIALPPGWEMASDSRGESPSQTPIRVQFVFKPADRDVPYLFVSVQHCAAAACRRRRKRAAANEHRRFLSGGATDSDYFDSRLNVLWRRSEKASVPSVNATFFGERIATFKFFHEPGHFGDLATTLGIIVKNIRVGQPGDEAVVYRVDPNLFASASRTPFYQALLWGIPLALVVLVTIERAISRRRQKEAMAQIDADIAERKEQSRLPGAQSEDAESYYRQTLASRRK